MKYLAVLGRQPEISVAELEALFGEIKKISNKLAVFKSEKKPEIDPLVSLRPYGFGTQFDGLFIFLYNFSAMNTTAAAHAATHTSTAHSGTRPLWYSAGKVSISMCSRIAIGRRLFFAFTTPSYTMTVSPMWRSIANKRSMTFIAIAP